MTFNFQINENIKTKTVRVVDGGDVVGVISTDDAINMAFSKNLDLIMISNDEIPTCKIADYNKYVYELKRKVKEKEKMNRANRVETKEINLRPVTDSNDIAIKAKKAQSFIDSGNKVKVSVVFRGRELHYIENGVNVIDEFLQHLENVKFDKDLFQNDKQISCIIMKGK